MLGIGAGMGIACYLFTPIWTFLEKPYCSIAIADHKQCNGRFDSTLMVNRVFDGFFLHLKIAFIVARVISSPVWLYQLWALIAPGLYARRSGGRGD